MSFEESFNAGMLAIKTVGAPTAHGAVVTGVQGIGVKTPKAAAVAEATVGFDIELHMPKGRMFTPGLLSLIFAHGVMPLTLFAGRTDKLLGATPKLH